MIFFQDTRSIGMIFWLVTALLGFNAAMVLIGAFDEGSISLPDNVTDVQPYCLVIGVGGAVATAIYAWNAHWIMVKRRTRLEVIRNYVRVVGLCTVIGGICGALAMYMFSDAPMSDINMAVAAIILGAVILAMSVVIGNGKKGLANKVVWGVLAVAFVLMALEAISPADNYWEYAEHIAHLIISVFMLSFVADGEVRREMGVAE